MMIPKQSYCYSSIVVTLFFFVLHILASPCLHDQRDALLEFKHEFPVNESSTAYMSSWNKSSDCCSWTGVACDAESGKVISLYVENLNNSLKPNSSLFKLQYLQFLSLYNCNLYGVIPSSLGNLSSLTYLSLANNELVGKVPASVGNLTQLTNLQLYNNFLSELPPDMSQLQNLGQILLSENFFFGPFPTSLFMIPLLQHVALSENQFKGPIELGNTSRLLMSLYLSHNQFDGPIPRSISIFTDLTILDLSYNNFIGQIPSSISELVNITHLDLSNNCLEGQVPSSLWKLQVLQLSHNSFSSFEKSSSIILIGQRGRGMSLLDLASNSFREPFPHLICQIAWGLSVLDLSNNSFSGSIPLSCLKNITNALKVLSLRSNNFSGILPDIFVNATELHALDVSHNSFEGKLPKALINCKSMKVLGVGSNKFKDKFPSWLGSLPALSVLSLRSNKFYGSLYHSHESTGFQNLKVIDVSLNDFTGAFPTFYFSSWREMTTSNANGSLYSNTGIVIIHWAHEVTVSYKDQLEMVLKGVNKKFEMIQKDFVAIDFSGNKFRGRIPESIGLLKGLRLLNLSNNAFTSDIPISLANLTNLEALDLSWNQLLGQIPGDLGILSFLSTMDFSHNNLEGLIPQGTQFQLQNCSSFMDNPRLHGFEESCKETHAPNPTPQELEQVSNSEEPVINWIAAAIAFGPGVFCGALIGHIFVSGSWKEMFRRIKTRVVITSAR